MPKQLLNLVFITAAIVLPLATWTRHWTLALIAGPVVLIAWVVIVCQRAAETRRHDTPRAYRHHDHNHDGN